MIDKVGVRYNGKIYDFIGFEELSITLKLLGDDSELTCFIFGMSRRKWESIGYKGAIAHDFDFKNILIEPIEKSFIPSVIRVDTFNIAFLERVECQE